jgi:hypothetical protein
MTQAALEAVSKLSAVALGPKISDSKAPCAGNSGSISKRDNGASTDFRAQTRRAGAVFVHLCVVRRSLTPGQPRSSRLELHKNDSRRDRG